ncbi:hypothetical protein PVAND_012494 [Polypedilum vanderplanki]|uniref:Protein quiver n=1 Tax=Polypedilum vanderplanki TaxID=319348 RepID=A0A9J6CNM2_POLVA|nr:hypothetical protein PVAND_012494 [Polypedilum vanderplanki]
MTMKILLLFFCLISNFFTVYSLNCYFCEKDKVTAENCVNAVNLTEKECPSRSSVCIKLVLTTPNSNITDVKRDCSYQAPRDIDFCKGYITPTGKEMTCHICWSDYCNEANLVHMDTRIVVAVLVMIVALLTIN